MVLDKDVCTDIKYYQLYLKELISDYYINESICDFYDENKSLYIRYGNCLSDISKSLKYRQHMLCYLLFYEDKESKSIPKLLNRIRDTKIIKDKELDKAIKILAKEIEDYVDSNKKDIENLKEYRHNVYAHWNKKLFDQNWQNEFQSQHTFDFKKIITLSQKCIETLSIILSFLGEDSYVYPEPDTHYIEKFIKKLKS